MASPQRPGEHPSGKRVLYTNLSVRHLTFDHIFCGAGASASLLMLELDRRGLLEGKRVLLADPGFHSRHDKTFCFWSEVQDPILQDLSPVISHAWSTVEDMDSRQVALHPWRYYYVSSRDLHSRMAELAAMRGWTILTERVDEILSDEAGPVVRIGETTYQALHVYDSRTPAYLSPAAGETHLLQSFEGWVIRPHHHVFQPDTFRFMDFRIAQDGQTQFVYVLPFAPDKALVEVTRFGAAHITPVEAQKILTAYIADHYGIYDLLEKEHGCIPMSNCAMESKALEGVINLGGRAGMIKASTGYAFRNMYEHARNIADQLEAQGTASVKTLNAKRSSSGRFAFYDALLLDILGQHPESGRGIFTSLITRVNYGRIFRFLDEKTSIGEEVSIFRSLPFGPFIRSLARRMWHSRFAGSVGLMLVTIIMMLLQFTGALHPYIVHGLLIGGLVTLGIPHGAVDHLVETGARESGRLPRFILSYVAAGTVMGVVWYAAPVLGLISFLIYSAWHFGKADGEAWRMSTPTSLAWGGSVLLFILGTHQTETNTVLATMGALYLPFSSPWWMLLPWSIYAISQRQWPMLITLVWLTMTSELPLLLSFGLYFIGQHSLVSWQHLKTHLKMNNRTIWMNALPFHGAAWLLFILFYFFWPRHHGQAMEEWGIFFIFLACVSFPHVLAMRHVFSREKTTKIIASISGYEARISGREVTKSERKTQLGAPQ